MKKTLALFTALILLPLAVGCATGDAPKYGPESCKEDIVKAAQAARDIRARLLKEDKIDEISEKWERYSKLATAGLQFACTYIPDDWKEVIEQIEKDQPFPVDAGE